MLAETITNAKSSAQSRIYTALDNEQPPTPEDNRPYGCTFDGCVKVFESKNEWKRHEQGVHEQSECWRCHKCSAVFFRVQKSFIDHVMDTHGDKRTEAETQAKTRRIPYNHQGGYWCGFCNEVITHDLTGIDAVNIRVDHIGKHFEGGESSGEWIELGGRGKTKSGKEWFQVSVVST